jgi:hypothetical protein
VNELLFWVFFNAFVVLMLVLDLTVFHRKAHAVQFREALAFSAMWIGLAVVFAIGVYFWRGRTTALEFAAGYLVEESLSVDNLFVFLLIFRYFRVPQSYQHKVLLNQWVMQLGPEKKRGRYFAFKDIVGTLTTALVSYGMAWQLDVNAGRGMPLNGYVVVYGFCAVFSIVDAVLMCSMREPPSKPVSSMKWADLMAPLKNTGYRPVLLFNIFSYFASFLCGPFLSVYQLQYLNLNHSFITAAGIVCSLAGMLGIWFWGHVADRTYWHVVVLMGGGISALCNLGWFLVPAGTAKILAPLLMAFSAAGGVAGGMAGLNLQYDASPQNGKTTYLGVTASMASLVGYASATLGSLVQKHLQASMGLGSMRVLFLLSAISAAAALMYGWRHLPKRKQS